mgnify:FL=1
MASSIERALKKGTGEEFGESPSPSDQTIGQILVAHGVLDEPDVEVISEYAMAHELRFGEAALAKKMIRQKDLDKALAHQFRFPYIQPGRGSLSKELVAAYKPFSRQAEIFRHIRAQLMLGSLEGGRKMLAVVSPSKKDGRSYLAANLAVVFAQLGKRTLLVDCHMQNPRQHKIFRAEGAQGISSVLLGRGDKSIEPKPISEIENLSVFVAGACPPNPDELVAGDAFGRLCHRYRREYDVVLVDTPPGNSSTAVDWIAARCGSVLIVYRRHKTRLREARDFSERMRARALVAGAILNRH